MSRGDAYSSQGQRDGKYRALAELAGDANTSAVSVENRLGDCKPHPGSLYGTTAAFAAVELVKNQGLLEFINTSATIGNTDTDFLAGTFRRDSNRRARGRILC